MILTIDIGNTNINLGIFGHARLIRKFVIPTKSNSYFLALKKILTNKEIDKAIICSVVPKATLVIERDLKKLKIKCIYVLGRDIKVPIRNLYRKPKQVGQDRLVGAYAAAKIYAKPAIVVDFGTAITFDVVSKNNEYLGGMIIPGIRISLKALYQNTALLPDIRLSRPGQLIGRDTKESILSGMVYGFSALADGVINKIKKLFKRKVKVIGTGGNIKLISPYCSSLDYIDADLILKGLHLISLDNL
jgi:type III pantothenate kinase